MALLSRACLGARCPGVPETGSLGAGGGGGLNPRPGVLTSREDLPCVSGAWALGEEGKGQASVSGP